MKTKVKYHTVECLKCKASVRKYVDQLEDSYIADRNAECTFETENSSAVSCEVKIHLPYNPTILVLHI